MTTASVERDATPHMCLRNVDQPSVSNVRDVNWCGNIERLKRWGQHNEAASAFAASLSSIRSIVIGIVRKSAVRSLPQWAVRAVCAPSIIQIASATRVATTAKIPGKVFFVSTCVCNDAICADYLLPTSVLAEDDLAQEIIHEAADTELPAGVHALTSVLTGFCAVPCTIQRIIGPWSARRTGTSILAYPSCIAQTAGDIRTALFRKGEFWALRARMLSRSNRCRVLSTLAHCAVVRAIRILVSASNAWQTSFAIWPGVSCIADT